MSANLWRVSSPTIVKFKIAVRTRRNRYSDYSSALGTASDELNRQSQNNNDQSQSTINLTSARGHCNEATHSEPLANTMEQSNQHDIGYPIRNRWSVQDKEELMWCFEYAKLKGTTSYKQIFEIWRTRNPGIRMYIDAKKLSNQLRYVENNVLIGLAKMEEIKLNARQYYESGNDVQPILTIEAENDMDRSTTQPEAVVGQVMEAFEEGSSEEGDLKDEIFMKYYEIKQKGMMERDWLPKVCSYIGRTKEILKMADQALEKLICEIDDEECTITELNHLIYATATVVIEKCGRTRKKQNSRRHTGSKEPPWKIRIQKQIQGLRKETSILVEVRQGNMSRSLKKVKDLFRIHGIEDEEKLNIVIENLKQKISSKTQRINRYSKRIEQFNQNRMYNTDRKQFFRRLGEKRIEHTESPSENEIDEYWRAMYEVGTEYNKEAEWLRSVGNSSTTMDWTEVSEAEVSTCLKNIANWKSPGIDKIQNFWLKNFTSTHKKLANIYNGVINGSSGCDSGNSMNNIVCNNCDNNNTNQCNSNNNNGNNCNNNKNNNNSKCLPKWLTEGITYLLPKNEDTKDPKNYRPITCLTTMYKLFTTIIASRIGKYVQENRIMPKEQKGCCKGSYGCKDQLIASKLIMDDCRYRKTTLSMGWIDYRKAYDSVPHDWILESMKRIGIPQKIIGVCKSVMAKWTTNIILTTNRGEMVINDLKIRRGIFQGDALSPLMFCISLIPLSHLINLANIGYRLKGTQNLISHLLYMDDIKLLCKNEHELTKGMKVVKEFSDDIRMSFGLDKCATLNIKAGRRIATNNLILDENTEIKFLEVGVNYKYLGIEEAENVDQTEMKQKLTQEYKKRVRAILRTELNGKNKIHAIGSLATPVLQYSFGIINWKIEEVRELDRKTRKLLTTYKQHSPLADIHRLYVNRKQGGRGLQQLEMLYKTSIINLVQYLTENSESDEIVSMIKQYDDQLAWQRSLSFKARKFLEELNVTQEYDSAETSTRKKSLLKSKMRKMLQTNWREKVMHGQHLRELESLPVDKEQSFLWLNHGNLKGETESLLIAVQDQAIKTNYYRNKILNEEVSLNCRVCQSGNETIEHIIAACPVLAKAEYIERHDNVARQLHYNICKEMGINILGKWYQHTPKAVEVTPDDNCTVIWNQQVQTDRPIRENKPDIIVKPKNGVCLLIDVSVPTDRNVINKEGQKILKYKDLLIETQRMWNSRVKIVPVVIGATGSVSKNFQKYLSQVPGKHNMTELQKTAILGTAHIVRRVLT